MSEPGDKVFAIYPDNLVAGTIVRRNGNGSVVLSDILGIEWNAEAICIYRIISRVQPPTPSTPSLGPTPTETEPTSASNGLQHPASIEATPKRRRGTK